MRIRQPKPLMPSLPSTDRNRRSIQRLRVAHPTLRRILPLRQEPSNAHKRPLSVIAIRAATWQSRVGTPFQAVACGIPDAPVQEPPPTYQLSIPVIVIKLPVGRGHVPADREAADGTNEQACTQSVVPTPAGTCPCPTKRFMTMAYGERSLSLSFALRRDNPCRHCLDSLAVGNRVTSASLRVLQGGARIYT